MNNLEEAYRKSIQEETPDLWNRIASALPEKPVVEERKQDSPFAMMQPEQKENPASAQKPKKIYQFNRFMKAAAAVLFLAVLIPGAWFLLDKNGGLAQSENAAMDTADAGAAMDVAEGAAAGDTNGGVAVTTDMDSDSYGYSNEEAGLDNKTEDLYADANEEAVAECEEVKEVGENAAQAVADSEDPAPAEGAALGNDAESQADMESAVQMSGIMMVESIICEEVTGQEETETLYRLRTEEGEVFEAILSEDLTVTLTEGNTYRFTLQEVSGEVRNYCIVSVEEVKTD